MHPSTLCNQREQPLADWLAGLLPSGRPRRMSQMREHGDKYRDLPKKKPLDGAMLDDHARGVKTYATTLDANDRARAGAIDIDKGGRPAIDAVRAAAAELGLIAWAIAVDDPDPSGHCGGHVWILYEGWHPVAAIAAQLRQVAALAGLGDNYKEVWPSERDQVIRLPFGFHVRVRTRGQLVLQDGRTIDLDRDLVAGFAAVQALPLNAAPPTPKEPEMISVSIKPFQAFSSPQESQTPHHRGVSTGGIPQLSRRSPGEAAAERLTAEAIAAAIAVFNRAHPLSTMLERGPGGNYFCPCGGHSSKLPKIAIWTGPDGIERGQSYSPDCRWFPQHRNPDKYYLDPFQYYVLSEHGGDRVAALKIINPIAPNRAFSRPEEEPPHPAEEYLTQGAARQRAARQAARDTRQARIAPLVERAPEDPKLYLFARQIFAFHVDGWAEQPEHYASVERIARTVLGLDRPPTEHETRRVQLAHKRLIALGYLKRTVRYRADSRKTNCWQPGDGGMVIRAETAHQEAINETRITMIDHDSESLKTCERGGNPRASLEKPNGSVFVELPSPAGLDAGLLSYVRQLARELGEVGWYLNDYATWSAEALEAEALRLEALLQVAGDMPPAATEEIPQLIALDDQAAAGELESADLGPMGPTGKVFQLSGGQIIHLTTGGIRQSPATGEFPQSPVQVGQVTATGEIHQSTGQLVQLQSTAEIPQLTVQVGQSADQVDDVAGATYNPAADWTAEGGQLDPQLRDPAYNPLADLGAPAPAGEEFPHLVDLVEPEPLVRCPPVEPAAAAQYWKLLGRAKKSTSASQRQLLEGKAAALEIWLPISEAPSQLPRSSRPLRFGRAARVAPPLTSSPPGAGQVASETAQAGLWGAS